jgi:hypothetical protein
MKFSPTLKLFLGLVAGQFLISGCATTQKFGPSAQLKEGQRGSLSNNSKKSEEKAEGLAATQPTAADSVSQTQGLVIRGVTLKNSQFDYPVVANSRVEFWIDYFTGRGRPHFEKYLERSEFFIPYIAPLLKSNRMPEDLVYLAMIESGFNNWAKSSAKAVGPWQFMSATGKRYGLSVNWWVDERKDIKKSTLAAVDYLKDLYGIFGSWELAAAAYNAGEAKIARAVQRYGTKDFWTLARGRFLRPETRDYVPKIMAAAIIGKNRELFGFQKSSIHPKKDEAIAPDGSLVKIEAANNSAGSTSVSSLQGAEGAKDVQLEKQEAPETIADLLASEDEGVATKNAGGVTSEKPPELSSASLQDTRFQLARPIAHPFLSKSGEVTGEEIMEFEVKSPADLLKIAEAAGLSYLTVKSLNPEILRWCTPPLQGAYRIRLPASSRESFLTNYNRPDFPRRVEFLAHPVRKGDTLAKIARRYGIKVDPIADLNGIHPRSPLRPGRRVVLPMPNDRSRSVATLEIRDAPEKSKRHRKKRRHARVSSAERNQARQLAAQASGQSAEQ